MAAPASTCQRARPSGGGGGLAQFEWRSVHPEAWLSRPGRVSPVVLCGDLNCGPQSGPYRLLRQHLRDAQVGLNGRRPHRTWLSHLPVRRIDHIFVGSEVRVLEARVLGTRLARIASDHLPLLAEVELPRLNCRPVAVAEAHA